jgi:hypothetical protein
MQALEGSEVRFRLQSNRPLREGSLDITAGDRPPQHLVMKPSGGTEVTGSFTATDSGRIRFTIVDASGLPSQGDAEGALTVTHDLPPEVHISNPQNDAAAAMDFQLKAEIDASDDYGLREIRFHRGLNGVYSAPKVFKYDKIVLDSGETVHFDFASLGVHPGDVITLFAEAVDNAPQPHLSRSQTVHLQVISVEDYNNYLREQTDISDAEAKYSALNDDLQQLIDKQKELGDAAKKLESEISKADTDQKQTLARELDSLIARQNELNQKFNPQAARMENFVRQQPLYDVEKDLQDRLRQQAANIHQSTRADDTAARAIAQGSSPGYGPRQLSPDMLESFKAASDAQAARLGQAHQDTDKQVVQPLDDMTAMQELINDFNTFTSLYQTQQDIAQQAQAYNRPGQMSREDQLALKDLAATEKQVSDTLSQLQAKLTADAAAATGNFPNAALSGRHLRDQIAEHLMVSLADQATDQMLDGAGGQSFEIADRLRGEMDKLFNDCQGGNCPGGNELDTFLTLNRMNPGGTFSQMSRSRKFGFGQGRGEAGGRGQGMMGTSGYAVMDGASMDILGNESFAQNTNASSRQSSRYGKGAGALAAGARGLAGEPDVVRGLNPVNRQSAAETSQADIEEYNAIVESYFKAITTKKESQANEPSK